MGRNTSDATVIDTVTGKLKCVHFSLLDLCLGSRVTPRPQQSNLCPGSHPSPLGSWGADPEASHSLFNLPLKWGRQGDGSVLPRKGSGKSEQVGVGPSAVEGHLTP